jgi:hypothetical protein
VRVLLDECVDRRLARAISGHQVQTVPRMGWAGKRNGDLLSLVAAQFVVFVTVVQDLQKQHDISQYNIVVVVVIATSKRLADLQPLVPRLLANLNSPKPGEAIEIV